MQTTTVQGRWSVRPLDWEEGRAILRPLFADSEHWLMILHASGGRLLIEIEDRYFTDEKNPDLTVIAAVHRGQPFVLVAAKKCHMSARQYAKLLRQFTDISISARDLRERDLNIIAPDALMDAATELAVMLLSNDDLALAP